MCVFFFVNANTFFFVPLFFVHRDTVSFDHVIDKSGENEFLPGYFDHHILHIKKPNKRGGTFLHHTAWYTRIPPALVQRLVKMGADNHATNKYGETPLHCAMKRLQTYEPGTQKYTTVQQKIDILMEAERQVREEEEEEASELIDLLYF